MTMTTDDDYRDAVKRIGREVREQAGYITAIERDMLTLRSGLSNFENTVHLLRSSMIDTITKLDEKFDAHVSREDTDRIQLQMSMQKVIATNVGQIIALVIAVALIIFERLYAA